MTVVRWGIVSTIKAPAQDVLKFAAYHIDAGATRVIIFLDEPNPVAEKALRQHPKARVIVCDDEHWAGRGRRPKRHQTRQSHNATRAYHKNGDLDWIGHVDVDEFVLAEGGISAALARVPDDVESIRVRPIERLAGGDGKAYKQYIPRSENRLEQVSNLYPEFGQFLAGGFLSHMAGKLFVRPGNDDLKLRIHRIFVGDDVTSDSLDYPDMTVAHVHARSYDDWRAHFDFRHSVGSYRDELSPAFSRDLGGMTLHEVFAALLEFEGENGLRKFFDEVVGDSPELRARLKERNLLQLHDLKLDEVLSRQFPDVVGMGI